LPLWSRAPIETVITVADRDGVTRQAPGRRARVWPGARVDDLGRSGFGAVLITVPQNLAFVRAITLPRAIVDRAGDVLAADLERTTPLRIAEVVHGWFISNPNADRADVTVHHVVLKLSILAGLLSALERAKAPVRAIEVVDDTGVAMPVNLAPIGLRRDASAVRVSRGLVGGSALAAVAAATAWIATDTITATQTLAAADSRIAALTIEAQRSRTLASDATQTADLARRARLRRIEQPMMTAIWEELTATLPDDVWLTDLRFEDGAVTMEGQAANAADLIGRLSRLPLVADASFLSPVARETGRAGERFQMRLVLKTNGARPTP
jgi:general secretion pathway protein L